MFNSIAIVRKIDDNDSVDEIAASLRTYALSKGMDVHEYEQGTLSSADSDVLFVALGGDGTMLYASKESLKYDNSSVVGFNYGNLGFLVDNVHSMQDFFDGILNYYNGGTPIADAVKRDERMVLDVWIGDKHFIAMNEVVLSTGQLGPPFVHNVFINDGFVAKQFGSGVLVSTSTGSTAMALSAGGAIVSPSTNIMQIVPIIPHSLSSRPIITSGRDDIILEAKLTNRITELTTTIDGQLVDTHNVSQLTSLNSSNYNVQVNKHKKNVTIWRPNDWNFFNVLSQKMGW
jgi:NAD+ kinase